jgi:hypothetical protein
MAKTKKAPPPFGKAMPGGKSAPMKPGAKPAMPFGKKPKAKPGGGKKK